MFRKKIVVSLLLLLMSVSLVLSGCNTKKEPKEALKGAAINSLKMDSYVQTNKIKISNLTIEGSGVDQQEVGMILSMLKDAEININQIYQKEPMQTEATLEVKLTGDVATTITVPFVMTKEKIYVKIPSIPMLPMPESIVGKFIELDLKELAEQSGGEFNLDALDPDKTQKLAAELSDVLMGEFDSAKYFSNVSPDDVKLPEGFKAQQIVQFKITNDNFSDAITVLVKNALPKIIDVIAKEENRELLQLTTEQVDEIKSGLSEMNEEEFNSGLEEIKKYLTINTFTVNTAIDRNNYPSYSEVNFDFVINDPESDVKVTFAAQATTETSQINKKPEFQIGIPTDTITMEDLMGEFGGLGY